MRNACVVMLEGMDLAFIDVHAMGCNDFGIEQPLFLDIRYNRHALIATHVLHLKGGFGDVRV